MASAQQIRGMLLEEALLCLLRGTGYRTVDSSDGDETLTGPLGFLKVKGRGERHQIDAIADYVFQQPFTHPQRLLLEAKFQTTPVGLPIVRNAVGVVKDVAEYYVPARGGRHNGTQGGADKRDPAKRKRYHYLYALFSSSEYSAAAERYAFAQDIYLIQLSNLKFFLPVVEAIEAMTAEDLQVSPEPREKISLRDARCRIRELLRRVGAEDQSAPNNDQELSRGLAAFIDACRRIGSVLLAVAGDGLPVFLVPESAEVVRNLETTNRVRYYYYPERPTEWFLTDERDNPLFSFDMPPELFKLYDEQDLLTRQRLADAKNEQMSRLLAVRWNGDTPELVEFRLDREWLDDVRANLRETRRWRER